MQVDKKLVINANLESLYNDLEDIKTRIINNVIYHDLYIIPKDLFASIKFINHKINILKSDLEKL